MDIPKIKINFRDILQKLSVFKNNKSLLVSVIITVVAGLLFIPTQLMSSKLRKRIGQDSVKMGKDIKRLLASPINLSEGASQDQDNRAKDSNEVVNLARQTTQRELLSYDIFPEPDPNNFTPLVFQQFGNQFRKDIEGLITKINGNNCPTPAELQRRLENSAALSRGGIRGESMGASSMEYSSMEPMGMSSMEYSMGRGSMMGGASMFGSNNELVQMIIDEICLGRAKTTSVYVDPLYLGGYEFWANYEYDVVTEDAVKDCWYYQLAYWVIEDIFNTIGAMNSTYENVLTAPVKRLEHISFSSMGMAMTGRIGAGMAAMAGRMEAGGSGSSQKEKDDQPAYLLSVRDGLTESCTARFSDDEKGFDVIHFNVAVIMNAKAVLPFMQELCSAKEHQFTGYPSGNEAPQTFKHNQITILEARVVSIKPDSVFHNFYRYGEDPVIELDMICEYIFNREGYEPIKPEPVKKTLRGEDEEKKKRRR